MQTSFPKLVPNSRYAIHMNIDASSKHETRFEVHWGNRSPNYGWRAFYLIDTFDTKEEAETLIERLGGEH